MLVGLADIFPKGLGGCTIYVLHFSQSFMFGICLIMSCSSLELHVLCEVYLFVVVNFVYNKV